MRSGYSDRDSGYLKNAYNLDYSQGAAPVVPSTLPNGLIHYWTLDEAAGNSRLDSVGSATLDEAYGTPVVSVAAKHNNGARFIGATKLTRNYLPSLPQATLAFWLYRTGTMSNNAIIENGSYAIGNNPGWSLTTNNAGHTYELGLYSPLYGGFAYSTNNVIVSSAWLHIVVTYDGSAGNADRAKFYVNTVGVSSGVTGTMANGLNLGVGEGAFRFGTDDGEMRIDLDEVGLWNRVLTSDEIAELYAAGAGKFYPF